MIKSKAGKEITSIYTIDEKEIIEVRDNQDNIVYSAIKEISGVPPLRFMSRGGYLQDYRIYGNTVQNGTPTPENPVQVQGCGEYDAELNGYKIPVTVSNDTNSVTTPIYIGSEPLHKIGYYADYVDYKRGVVVRRIKKLVLMGNEPDLMLEASSYFYLNNPIENAKKRPRVYSSHFMGGDNLYNNNTVIISNTGRLNFTTTDIPHSVAEFASFLAQQYEAGTPVTVWYVLAEPEEEPLENLLPIQTIKGTNVLTVDTTVQPSNIWIKGKIKAIN